MAATKCFFLFFAFLQTQTIVAAPQAQKNGHPNADGHQQLKPRTVAPLSSQSSQTSTSRHLSSTASSPFHLPTFVTIRAVPIRITKQMQYVTSYNPIVTICPLAGQPLPIQPSLPLPGLPNGTNPTLLSTGILPRSPDLVGKAVLARQVANVTTCETFWEPIPTPICHTTLSPLAAPLIVVSECHQSVTFSSQFGYVLASGISAPTVVTTYYVAPWSELHPGSVPTKSVVAKVCSSGRRDCTTKKEKWDMQLSEYTEVARKTVLVHVTIVGVSCAVSLRIRGGIERLICDWVMNSP